MIWKILSLSTVLTACSLETPAKPNILHLMADDMRPQLGCYGHAFMRTPNLDRLASTGLLFQTAYTQFAYCAPSRNSFMTGRRPERTKCLNFNTDFRKQHGASWVSMPEYFKNQGYFTSAAGKLFHDGMDDPASWSYKSNQTAWIQCNCKGGDLCDQYSNYCQITNKSKIPYTDEDLALAEGLHRMELAAASGKPWWIGIGIHRPHWASRLPNGWYGPQVYPLKSATHTGTGTASADVVLPPKHPLAPIGAPYMSGNWHGGDFRDPAHGCPNCSVPAIRSIEYRRWYYAATSYADHMLGKALDKLDELNATSNTIVLFHADHGYQLGELNEWSKKTDTELATHVPLIIRVPWKSVSVGKQTAVKAELVDLYRTLAELTGLNNGVQPDVQGISLAAAFDDPSLGQRENPKVMALASKPAFSQIGSCACQVYVSHGWKGKECGAGRCVHTPVGNFDFMGYSMRTADGWRYVAWVPMDNKTQQVDWSGAKGQVYDELYDLRNKSFSDFDFDGLSLNVADEHADLTSNFRTQMKAYVKSWY